MNNGIIGSSYHISTNKIIKISELVSMCCLIMGIEFDDISKVSEDRAGKDAVYRLDSSRLRDSLGWTDEIGLDEGLKRTYNWVKQNLDQILKFPTEYQHRK
jgi:dTDP-glucose 4,6-dehydratase